MSNKSVDEICGDLMLIAPLEGNCLTISVALAEALNNEGHRCCVVLGSLLCNGSTVFRFEALPSSIDIDLKTNWGGHAWVRMLDDELVIDLTVYSTAFAAPRNSNLRRTIVTAGAPRPPQRVRAYNGLSGPLEYKEVERLDANSELYVGVLKGFLSQIDSPTN